MTRVRASLNVIIFKQKSILGGGYLLWTSYVICQETIAFRILLIILALIYMLYMVLFLSSATDE